MKGKLWLLVIMAGILAISAVIAAPDPTGAALTARESSRGTNTAVQNLTAQGGNVTAVNVDQDRITDVWQGFYGNVTGGIVLENSAGNNFYDWTIASIAGQVYATRNTVASWANVNCTNSTEWQNEETALNIPSSATDGINETYSAINHPSITVAARALTNCPSTRAYNSSGLPGTYWNVLLNTDPANIVYASIISDNADAFGGSTADFEIMVPVNKTTSQMVYFFYAELN